MPVEDKIIKYKFNSKEKQYWINHDYSLIDNYIYINQCDLFRLKPSSSIIITYICNCCHNKFYREIKKLSKLNTVNNTLCKTCRNKHRNKKNELMKREQTCLIRYGFKNPMQVEFIKNRYISTIQNKYGIQYTSVMQIPEIRNKQIQSLYNNNKIATSKQQKYLHNLFGGELNYICCNYIIDIAFIDDKIAIEYDGSGHDLSVKLGRYSLYKFNEKEHLRNNILINSGWKIVHLIAPHDKLLDDLYLLQLIDISKNIFNITNNKLINIYLEENKLEYNFNSFNINELIN